MAGYTGGIGFKSPEGNFGITNKIIDYSKQAKKYTRNRKLCKGGPFSGKIAGTLNKKINPLKNKRWY